VSSRGVPGGGPRPALRWAVVVPVKPWAEAKSRLAREPSARAALARAFTLDVVEAARSTVCVDAVLVVSREPALRELFSAVGSAARVPLVVADDRGRGLDDSVRLGVREVRRLCPGTNVAVVTGDLPSLRPQDLASLLAAAGGHRLGVVSDTEGTGTTVLTATATTELRPAFGAGSFTRHLALGAVDLSGAAAPGVRRDVDVDAQLRAARRLGVGRQTAALDDPAD